MPLLFLKSFLIGLAIAAPVRLLVIRGGTTTYNLIQASRLVLGIAVGSAA